MSNGLVFFEVFLSEQSTFSRITIRGKLSYFYHWRHIDLLLVSISVKETHPIQATKSVTNFSFFFSSIYNTIFYSIATGINMRRINTGTMESYATFPLIIFSIQYLHSYNSIIPIKIPSIQFLPLQIQIEQHNRSIYRQISSFFFIKIFLLNSNFDSKKALLTIQYSHGDGNKKKGAHKNETNNFAQTVGGKIFADIML